MRLNRVDKRKESPLSLQGYSRFQLHRRIESKARDDSKIKIFMESPGNNLGATIQDTLDQELVIMAKQRDGLWFLLEEDFQRLYDSFLLNFLIKLPPNLRSDQELVPLFTDSQNQEEIRFIREVSLYQGLAKLKEHSPDEAATLLRVLAGYTLEEIKDSMGIPLSRVRRLKSNGFNSLKLLLRTS